MNSKIFNNEAELPDILALQPSKKLYLSFAQLLRTLYWARWYFTYVCCGDITAESLVTCKNHIIWYFLVYI